MSKHLIAWVLNLVLPRVQVLMFLVHAEPNMHADFGNLIEDDVYDLHNTTADSEDNYQPSKRQKGKKKMSFQRTALSFQPYITHEVDIEMEMNNLIKKIQSNPYFPYPNSDTKFFMEMV